MTDRCNIWLPVTNVINVIGILSAARDNLSLSLSCNARIVKNHDSFTRDIRTDIIHHRFERSVLNEIDIINLQIKLFDLIRVSNEIKETASVSTRAFEFVRGRSIIIIIIVHVVSIRGVDDERMSCISRYNCGNINRVNRAKLYPRSVYKLALYRRESIATPCPFQR